MDNSDIKINIPTSQHVRVAKNQKGEEEISLPTDFDGSLPLRTVDVFFPGAIGLEFKSTDGLFRQLL
uniref:TDP43_N domain-containing protein n=1 Tax=Meloidogyne hapla TaxID=6305 RepID=A0A1I8C316_MELHA